MHFDFARARPFHIATWVDQIHRHPRDWRLPPWLELLIPT